MSVALAADFLAWPIGVGDFLFAGGFDMFFPGAMAFLALHAGQLPAHGDIDKATRFVKAHHVTLDTGWIEGFVNAFQGVERLGVFAVLPHFVLRRMTAFTLIGTDIRAFTSGKLLLQLNTL